MKKIMNVNNVIQFSVASFACLTGVLLAEISQAEENKHLQKAPECKAIVENCKKAGYMPGAHKKNGKGLWVDCIKAIADGGSVSGVSASKEEAEKCMAAHKERHDKDKKHEHGSEQNK